RSYVPTGQQSRMVTLFIGLYAAAGIGAPKTTSKPSAAPRPPSAPTRRKAIIKPEGKKPTVNFTASTGLPPVLDGLLKSLPPSGQGWTQEMRDKFYETFGTVLDFCYPIGEQPVLTNEDYQEEESE